MKKIISLLMASVLLLTSGFAASAEGISSPKEEVIYGLLNLDGSVDTLYVVNSFDGGSITDYGDYSEIRNLTTEEILNQNDDQITISTIADKFYYQGTLATKDLPWDIHIQYYLDGNEIAGNELAGKSGALKITISIQPNSNSNPTFYDSYALQISLSLDSRLCSNIKADKATIAQAGGKKQLAFTVLPGNGAEITVSADIQDFEMDPITLNGIKLAMDFDVDAEEFTGQIAELSGAIEALDEGAGELSDGLDQLADGMQSYIDGMKAFKDGLRQLSDGAGSLDEGASSLKYGLTELAKQNDPLINGVLALQQAAFDAVNAELGKMNLGLPALTPENYSTVLSQIPDLAAVKMQLDGTVQFVQGLQGYMDGVALLSKGASKLADGTTEFKSSSSQIASSANDLYKAGTELNEGIKKTRDGLASYKDGTAELRDETSDMDEEIVRKIDEMLGSISGKDDKVVSFVSDKNTEVTAVQFVLKTAPVSVPEVEKPVAAEPERLNFMEKLLKLFGLHR